MEGNQLHRCVHLVWYGTELADDVLSTNATIDKRSIKIFHVNTAPCSNFQAHLIHIHACIRNVKKGKEKHLKATARTAHHSPPLTDMLA